MATEKDTANLPKKACKFCVWSAGSGKARECRYNPPRATGFPRVKHDDYCSKYEPDDILIDVEIRRKAEEADKALKIQKALNPK